MLIRVVCYWEVYVNEVCLLLQTQGGLCRCMDAVADASMPLQKNLGKKIFRKKNFPEKNLPEKIFSGKKIFRKIFFRKIISGQKILLLGGLH